ncbi:hypothetical protein AGLY_017878 [Aphis glycines]|uniref:Uncharacterized protein n=1 Tax=Aphis glycines TaxID=307491 RepID=A0A6G0SUT3_APHGL|nr:hypothetical protein AGLY_017878 [Aphis glycines]
MAPKKNSYSIQSSLQEKIDSEYERFTKKKKMNQHIYIILSRFKLKKSGQVSNALLYMVSEKGGLYFNDQNTPKFKFFYNNCKPNLWKIFVPNLSHNIIPSAITSDDTITSHQTNQVVQNYASPFAPIQESAENSMINTPSVIDTSWYNSSDMDVSSHSLAVETEINSTHDLLSDVE